MPAQFIIAGKSRHRRRVARIVQIKQNGIESAAPKRRGGIRPRRSGLGIITFKRLIEVEMQDTHVLIGLAAVSKLAGWAILPNINGSMANHASLEASVCDVIWNERGESISVPGLGIGGPMRGILQ